MNNIIYDPNFIPGQPVYIKTSEDRLIPFLGGAIIGGLGGAAIANNQGYYGGGYYPYYQPVYYYPYSYYSYPTYQYPYNVTTTNRT